MAKRGRYLVGQKISDARIERILLGYAENQTAAEFIRHSKVTMRKPPAEKTVYQIYRLIRCRLYEVRFHHGEFWLDVADAPDEGSNFVKRMYVHFNGERRIPAEIARRRGMTKANRDQIIGETISFVCYPHATPKAYLEMIHKIIRVCGRLNEPVRNLQLWQFYEKLDAQTRWRAKSGVSPQSIRRGALTLKISFVGI